MNKKTDTTPTTSMNPQTTYNIGGVASYPQLRFKGFQGEWEKHSLGEVIQLNGGMDYKHLGKGDIPVYGTGGYMLSVDKSLSNDDAIGIGRKGTIDKPYILKAPFWTVDTLFYAVPRKGNELQYCNCLFQNIDWKMLDESTGVPSLSKNIINSVEVFVSNKEEQQLLGTFFSSLDRLLSAEEQKVAKLKQLKTASLQDMFPQEGQSIPKIRFKGFQGEWEKVKLGEIIQLNGGMDYKHLEIGDIPVYGTGGYMLSVNKALSYDRDAIGIGRKGTIDKPYILKAPFWTVDTLFYAIPKGFNDLQFCNCLFQKVDWKKCDESTGVPSLSKNVINSLEVCVTVNVAEQRQLGKYFSSLDRQITLHSQRLTALRQVKTACLDKMFA